MNVSTSVDNVRVIAHFDSSIISGTTFTVPIGSVKSKEVRELLEHYDVHRMQAVFRNRYNSLGLIQTPVIKNNSRYFLEGWQLISVKGKARAEELVCLLKEQKGVKEAFVELPLRVKPSISPNDPYFVNGSQWHLKSISNPLADIDAEAAWDINRGRNDVIIAVADGGVDYNHPDLDPGNKSRVISGYDFGDFDSDPMDDLPDNNPLSYADHGTKVAGAIGAITNDSAGVAGIMWNCKIMPLKMVSSFTISYPFIGTIFDFSTTALPSSTALAIDYAVSHGAHVINTSYGISGLGYTLAVVTQQLSVLYDAIANAYENNVVLVAVMDNEYQQGNPVEYPAGFYEVIGVGQTNSSLQRVGTSNTGTNIDVSAPGSYNTTSRNNSYAPLNGTSSATPVVSGVAGLVISQGLDRSFNLTNDDIKHILETTADDIDPTGWDEETGYRKVNAYNALQLLDEPNELYHYTSTGGASVKIQTLDQWILTDGRWGLAPGTYLSVDQYKITRHVTFNVPFCSPPKVWMRERQSKSLSYGNPNNGRTFCIITNVSNTGFDIEYATYYVRYNLLGQTINTWVPSAPASTYVAYTAIGEPNLAANAGPVTGPSFVCSSGASFTVNNLPTGATIVWNQGTYLTRTSEQGSNPCTFTSTGSGSSWVRATLITDCGSVTLTDKAVWAGTPVISSVSGPTYTPNNQWAAYYAQPNNPAMGVSDYSWILNPLNGNSVYDNGWNADIAFYNSGNYQLVVRGQNTCGWGNYTVTGIEVYDSEGLSIFPNPASGEVTLTIETSDEKELPVSGWDLEIYAPNMMLKEKRTRLKDNQNVPELQIIVSFNKPDKAQALYKERWQIESAFKALKTSGFNIEDTHLSDVERVGKLLSLVLIAFAWVYRVGIYLDSLKPIEIKKHGRRAKSLFKYGLTYIAKLLFSNDLDKLNECCKFLSCT